MVKEKKYEYLFASGILKSIQWQFSDKIIKLFGSFIVAILLGRYLGPDQFGILNFIYAFIWLFATIASLGIDEVIIKELIEFPDRREKILGNALFLKIMGSTITLILIITFTKILSTKFEDKFWLLFFTLASMLIRNLNVTRLWYESQIQSKRIMLIENAAYFIGLSLKILFIFTSKSVEYFAFTAFAEFFISTVLFYYSYKKGEGKTPLPIWDKDLSKKILHQSWPLIVIGVSIMLYTRSDQVMLSVLSTSVETGYYSAAIRISEVFYFVPTAITIAIFPTIVRNYNSNSKEYGEKIQTLFDILCILAIIFSIGMVLLAYPIIIWGFGEQYKQSISILRIHIWSSIFVFLGVASSKIMVTEKTNHLNMYCTALGAVMNITLNIIFIPLWGGKGAAIATGCAQFTSVFSIYLFYKTRPIGKMLINSLNLLGIIRRNIQF